MDLLLADQGVLQCLQRFCLDLRGSKVEIRSTTRHFFGPAALRTPAC
jgi:hypothetical protein